MQLKAIYRIAAGTKILRTSYDFNDGIVGPYTIPTILKYDQSHYVAGDVYWHQLYECMLHDEDALACIGYAGCIIYVVTLNGMYGVGLTNETINYPLPAYNFGEPITKHTYTHIGYIAEKSNYVSVTQLPTFLVANEMGETNVPGLKVTTENIVINPHINLYKELLKTRHGACYLTTAGEVVYALKNKREVIQCLIS